MASYGSLIFYGKNGLSDPYSLSYGKTTIGTSVNHHIRIKGDNQISCVLDTNEDGVTVLVNENEDKNILINNVPAEKYSVIEHGNVFQLGKIKFEYSNPSIEKSCLEQTQKTLDKKFGTKENIRTRSEACLNVPSPLKRLQNVVQDSNKRRFSTGSKLNEVRNSPRLNKHTSTPQSASKVRFSQRMLTRRNSMLASVKENEVFEFQSPMVNFVASPISKKRTSLLSAVERKNRTFSGSSKFSSPVPAKNKTYSGNISDVSELVTTPENNVTAASITPLNVSKKTKKSLNRSRTLSYVDFPDKSSTPKSAIKPSRSSSLYQPIVEDITPASPLPRSSPRYSSLKNPAFTQRRSVVFNTSSSTDNSIQPEEEMSSTSSKRKREESISELIESSKRRMSSSLKESNIEDIEDQNSLHNSSLSGIHNLSDTSSNSIANGFAKVTPSSKTTKNISPEKEAQDVEDQSIVSWDVEMSSTNMNLSGDSESIHVTETPSKSKISTRFSSGNNLNLNESSNEKIGDFSTTSHTKETSETLRTEADNTDSETITLHLTNSLEKAERSSRNVSTSIAASILDESFSSSNQDSEPSITSFSASISRKSNLQKRKSKDSKVRSKSLNLDRGKKSVNKLSRTLGNLVVSSSEESLENSMQDLEVGKIASTPIVKSRGKILNRSNNSPRVSSRNNTGMSLNISPIVPKVSELKRSRKELSGNSTDILFGSKLNASIPEYNDSTNKLFEFRKDASVQTIEDTAEAGNSKLRNALETPKSYSASKSSHSRVSSRSLSLVVSKNASFGNSEDIGLDGTGSKDLEVLFKTPKAKKVAGMSETPVGAKRIMGTPKVQNSPKNDLTDIEGVKNLLKTPRVYKSPKNDLSDVGGIKKLLKTPRVYKSPKNDLSDVGGVKNLLKTPRIHKSPKNDLTSIGGVKKLLETPKVQKSPKNDLTDVRGVKQLIKTPKIQKLPKNDLTNVAGIRKLLSTPKTQNSPKNDLTQVAGVKKLMSSPKQQRTPKNDLTEVKGVKKMFKTPKEQKEPKNNLLDVRGVRQLLRTPKNKPADESQDLSGIDILFNESQESNFDKLFDKKPPRTYGKSPKANKSQTEEAKTPEHVLKWLEEQSQLEQTTTEGVESKREKRKLKNTSNTSEENLTSSSKRQKTKKQTGSALINESIISMSIISKPASTPKIEVRQTSPKHVGTSKESVERTRQGKMKFDSDLEGNHGNQEKIQEKQPTKRTRSKKETESTKPSVINTRTRRAKVQENSVNTDITPNIKTKAGKQEIEQGSIRIEIESGPNKRGKNSKKNVVEELSTNLEESETNKKRTTNRKRGADEDSAELENESGSRKRGKYNKNIDQDKSQEETENPAPVKKGRNYKKTKETQIKKNTRTKKMDTNAEQEDQPRTTKADNSENEERTKGQEDKKPPIKRSTRKTKKEDTNAEQEDQSRTTKADSSKNEKSVEEQDDKKPPIKRTTRKTKKENTNTEQKDQSRTTKADNSKNEKYMEEHVVEKSPVKRSTRRTKKGDTKTTGAGKSEDEKINEEENDKESPIKRSSKRTIKKNTDAKQKIQNKEEEDETKESPIKKNTRRTKKGAVNEEEEKPTRTTRANKGKNKKYNEEEWDTPVKKNSKKIVSFKADVDFLQTPANDATDGVRTLRKRKQK